MTKTLLVVLISNLFAANIIDIPFEENQRVTFEPGSRTKDPQFATLIPDTTYNYDDLNIDFNVANNLISLKLNFTFSLSDHWIAGLYPIFELTYAYGKDNQSIRQNYTTQQRVNAKGSFDFFVPQEYIKNGIFDLWCDLHLYWFNTLTVATTRSAPKVHHYLLNTATQTSITNFTLNKDVYEVNTELPVKLHIDRNDNIIFDHVSKIKLVYYFYNYFYYSLNNFHIMFFDSEITISNFIISAFAVSLLNIPSTNITNITARPIISGSDITFSQTIHTFYNPIEDRVLVGNSELYNSIDGVTINPFISNINGNIIFNFNVKYFLSYNFVVIIEIANNKPLFNFNNGILKIEKNIFINSSFFTFGGESKLDESTLH